MYPSINLWHWALLVIVIKKTLRWFQQSLRTYMGSSELLIRLQQQDALVHGPDRAQRAWVALQVQQGLLSRQLLISRELQFHLDRVRQKVIFYVVIMPSSCNYPSDQLVLPQLISFLSSVTQLASPIFILSMEFGFTITLCFRKDIMHRKVTMKLKYCFFHLVNQTPKHRTTPASMFGCHKNILTTKRKNGQSKHTNVTVNTTRQATKDITNIQQSSIRRFRQWVVWTDRALSQQATSHGQHSQTGLPPQEHRRSSCHLKAEELLNCVHRCTAMIRCCRKTKKPKTKENSKCTKRKTKSAKPSGQSQYGMLFQPFEIVFKPATPYFWSSGQPGSPCYRPPSPRWALWCKPPLGRKGSAQCVHAEGWAALLCWLGGREGDKIRQQARSSAKKQQC